MRLSKDTVETIAIHTVIVSTILLITIPFMWLLLSMTDLYCLNKVSFRIMILLEGIDLVILFIAHQLDGMGDTEIYHH